MNSTAVTLPRTMAVPVSWHPGSTIPAAMLAFFKSSRATNLSLLDDSGSFSMLLSCCIKRMFNNEETKENEKKKRIIYVHNKSCYHYGAKRDVDAMEQFG